MVKFTKKYFKLITIITFVIIMSLVGTMSYAFSVPELREIIDQEKTVDLENGIYQIFSEDFFDSLEENTNTDYNVDSNKNILDELGREAAVIVDDDGNLYFGEDIQRNVDAFINELHETFSNPVVRASLFGLIVFIVVLVSIKFIFSIIKLIAKWIMYNKAGKPGWGLLLPVYKDVLLLEMADLSPALLLFYFTFFIPFIGPFICAIAFLVIRIIAAVNLSKAFGKHGAFSIGLIFLPTIFYGILGFGKAEYKKAGKEAGAAKEIVKEELIEAKVETTAKPVTKTTTSKNKATSAKPKVKPDTTKK